MHIILGSQQVSKEKPTSCLRLPHENWNGLRWQTARVYTRSILWMTRVERAKEQT